MKTKIDSKIIVIIFLLIFFVIILCALLITFSQFNISEEVKIIIYGVAGGIATYAITFYITQKLFFEKNDKFEDIIKIFNPHDIDAKTILNTVQGSSIALVEFDRKKLLGKGYYESNFSRADDIRISGITVKALIEYLCTSNPTGNHLINQLKSRTNVSVKIVIMHPVSPIVNILNKQEHPSGKIVSDKIYDIINKLKDFSKVKNGSLANGSSIEIVITSQTMNFTISYAGNKVKNPNGVLLIGFLFGSKVGGPLYKVPNLKEISMYTDCLDYFDELYRNSSRVFSWNSSNKKFHFNINESVVQIN